MDNNGSAYRLLKNVVDTLNCKYKIFPVAGLIIASIQVSNESDIANILASLDSAGAFRGGLMKHVRFTLYFNQHEQRVLFSQTSAGRGSMVRQLQPRIHMETNAAVVQAITGKVANIMHYVAGNGASEASQIDDKSGQCVPISVESTAAIVDIILPFVAET
uniref:Uncharacterized protein n=1 Tax=Babesia bovis TaxID=5865 RepID=A7AN72_BABBO|eukprot:XP_001611574.1 hypothetical protein [Babesia bovis T2Bo]